jgi:2-oxoglutarate dehydrogenase E1 component
MSDHSFEKQKLESYLSAQNLAYIEALYEDYLEDSLELPDEWKQCFDHLPIEKGAKKEALHSAIKAYFQKAVKEKNKGALEHDLSHDADQKNVEDLVNAYREYGHLASTINPLENIKKETPRQLQLSTYKLNSSDLQKTFATPSPLFSNQPQATLSEIQSALEQTYSKNIGLEYMHIRDFEEVEWLQDRLEKNRAQPGFSKEKKLTILEHLVAADGLEKYLSNKYVGQKRFSLEGGDSFMPLMKDLVDHLGGNGAKEIVIGMAHRGRLNVLINLMGKTPQDLFDEFEGKKDLSDTSGDVKYHNGFSSDVNTSGGDVHLSLAFNPSHLECVSPVVMGSVRARQKNYPENAQNKVVPILVHGDSAFAGQGVVMENFAMSQTRAYSVGGSIHIVINNQVGFTTSHPRDTRSSLYCTDIAKMVDAPILHVNGDDPEAVVFAGQIAADYRAQFQKDVVIDLVCFRRHGHNEADEPSATQPLMYQKIKQHLDPWKIYAQRLASEKICTQEEADKRFNAYRNKLDNNESIVSLLPNQLTAERGKKWAAYTRQLLDQPVETGVPMKELKALAQKLVEFPDGFELQRQVNLLVKARHKMAKGEQMMDWGFAENLAYASLLEEGYSIRMTGQDCRRGTFAHRHATFHDQKTGNTYFPLQHIKKGQGDLEIYDSLLSEAGAVGFEFGYASTDPSSLVIWEAQFGDFANGAQVLIDQFISASWQKWECLSGLVMLLPHGQEGGGPEHSSARLERYLQLCAQDNMQVCNPTTPAQIFHLLRRQMVRPCRVPLIVMSPKSLLRHKSAVSTFEDLSSGGFEWLIPEVETQKEKKVKKVILCSGKVYYDLLESRSEQSLEDITIIRIEQLYPFPEKALEKLLKSYSEAKQVVWCQEEPKNQGAWFFVQPYLLNCLANGQNLSYVGRAAAASTAAGNAKLHNQQQQALVDEALNH